MKRIIFFLVISILSLTSCSKCYECKKPSSTRGACFDKASDAKQFKRDMENNGFDCRAVPEP